MYLRRQFGQLERPGVPLGRVLERCYRHRGPGNFSSFWRRAFWESSFRSICVVYVGHGDERLPVPASKARKIAHKIVILNVVMMVSGGGKLRPPSTTLPPDSSLAKYPMLQPAYCASAHLRRSLR